MLEPNFPYKCPFNCSIARSTLVNSSLFSSMLFLSLVLFVCNISSAFDFSVSKKHSPKTRSHFESSSAKVISDSASSVSSNCFCLREKSTSFTRAGKRRNVFVPLGKQSSRVTRACGCLSGQTRICAVGLPSWPRRRVLWAVLKSSSVRSWSFVFVFKLP